MWRKFLRLLGWRDVARIIDPACDWCVAPVATWNPLAYAYNCPMCLEKWSGAQAEHVVQAMLPRRRSG